MYLYRLFPILALACCVPVAPALGQDATPAREVLLIEQAMQNVIHDAEPSIVSILVSRSDVYRKLFHDQPPDDQPGKLGAFNPDLASNGTGRPADPAAPPPKDDIRRKYDLASPEYVPEVSGTGVVVDGGKRLILANYYLVRDATKIYVRVFGGKGSYADIHAADPRSDLVVLRLLDQQLPPLKSIRWGDAGAVKKGQLVVCIACPFAAGFRDGSPTASWGIISNLRRRAAPTVSEDDPRALYLLGTLIQTDTRLNRSATGAALFDLKGTMIGLLTARAAVSGADVAVGQRGDMAGAMPGRAPVGESETAGGLAMPVSAGTRRLIDRLCQGVEVEYGFLGVQFSPPSRRIDPGTEPQIDRIIGGSPAEKAGLRAGDVIVSVNGEPVHDSDELLLAVSMLPAGTEARIELRDRSPAQVTLAKYFVRGKIVTSRKASAPRGIRVDFTSVLWMQHDSAFQGFSRREIQPGVYVSEVQPGSPAAAAKLQVNDVITQINGRPVDSPGDFYREAAKVPASSPLELTLTSFDWGHSPRTTKLVIP
jgi:S1-C subfamily serine protease